MIEKLKKIEQRFAELAEQMADPAVAATPESYTALAREYGELEPIVQVFREYQKVQAQLEDTRALLAEADEEELREMAREELQQLEEREARLRKKLQQLLVPQDPNDVKNAIVEIRAGTGGDEAAIFAGDLFRMYQKYAENRGWKLEIISASPSERGGFKEIIFAVQGKGAYGRLKYESGVHRVQRVPETETQGRIHTSAASVVVLPEVADVEVEIDPNDLRIDVFRASGHGGQHVNTTDSAVRIVHLPTGLMATCQDEKSQHKNKAKALKVLKARLYDLELRKRQQAIDSQRKNAIRTGDRSEKIRTYNFPQNRLTDHRINLTLYRLEEILQGELDPVIDELQVADQAQQMQESQLSAVHE
ncbi:MAG: peptide chain release factor 1 [Calditrichaeota bacterium]|nr:MAG: peptide chain release factor 1 [Calditrichota bacterium]